MLATLLTLVARCHLELSMSRALQGYATDATTLVSPITNYNVAISMQQYSVRLKKKSTRILYGHWKIRQKYLGMPNPTLAEGYGILVPYRSRNT